MINVFELMEKEKDVSSEFRDEKIASNLLLTSYVRNLRSMANTSEEYKKGNNLDEAQIWLAKYSDKLADIPVMDFDNIVDYVDPDKTSCDAFFYRCNGDGVSFLVEMKNTPKRELLKFLKVRENDKDQIISKLKSAKDIITNHIEFTGVLDHDELVKRTHCIILYGGKNDVPTKEKVGDTLPKKVKVEKDDRNHQKRASRQSRVQYSSKEDVIERFGKAVYDLEFAFVTEDELPGDALPKVKKVLKNKVRFVSVMSAQDFGILVDSGFFNEWDWGKYSIFWVQKERDG